MKKPIIYPGDGILARSQRPHVFTNKITKKYLLKAVKGRQWGITVKPFEKIKQK